MKNSSVLLSIVALFVASCSSSDAPEPALASSEDAASELDARIARIENGLIENLQIKDISRAPFNIDDRLEELGIPGLSIAFAANGEVQWARAYGMADAAESREMTTDTYLLAGSISKPVAALRALQLVEGGVLDLDANINDYLTSWQVPDNEFTENEKVTLRRILTHTAGLTVWGFPGYDKGDDVPSTVDVLDGKGNTDPVRVYQEPGTGWQYSGGGYTIMQLAVSDNEEIGFVRTLENNVLDPMRMPNSTFANPLPEAMHSMAATGYRADGSEVEGKWPIYPEMAAAGLWTTPSELIQYGIEIQRILQSGEDGVISNAMATEMLDAEAGSHGLGPSVQEFTFGHGGADEGFRAQLMAWKDSPYALVVMVNSDNGTIIREVMLAVAKEYGLPGIEPVYREVASLEPGALERYEGRYEIEEWGVFQVTVDGERLKLSHETSDFTGWWYPQSELEFFGSESGAISTFNVEDGEVVGFTSNNATAVKLADDAPADE